MQDVLIVGAGLCGLALADALCRKGQSVQLLDARARAGGRAKSLDGVDLGPAWFWPGQPRMDALAARLDLQVFDQFATGAMIFEDAQGPPRIGQGYASMAGSLRVAGGMGALTDAVADLLPAHVLRLNAEVTALRKETGGITVLLRGGAELRARRVVLALPPRLAATLRFEPDLAPHIRSTLSDVPTWMAGQAKVVATYDTAFWREAGLSGDAMSRRGPLVEIHDASGPEDGPFGLFGFVGVPVEARSNTDALRQAALAQLSRLFGPQAAHPRALHVKDWAHDPFTATPADAAPLRTHPHYGLPQDITTLWQGSLTLSGSETARDFGGYLEGALSAAAATEAQLAR